ncbi:MAG: 3-deoxy-7-phosphoheptulonate synthase [Cyanobacteriota bacterium]
MLVLMKNDATEENINAVIEKIKKMGFTPCPIPGAQRTAIGIIGNDGRIDSSPIEYMLDVAGVIHVSKPFKRASKEFHPIDTTIEIEGAKIGSGYFAIIAGPCSVESYDQIVSTAMEVKRYGAKMLRGGAFKPRTGPYSFQGLGKEALEYLSEAKKITGLPVVTELMHIKYFDLVMQYADVIQVGARNMQNYDLLTELGKINKPVLLKRGMSATLDEFLLASEYILNSGNPNVILCERGIRTFETSTRNTLDLSSVALIKELSHLPVIVDPSHGTGKRRLIKPMSLAAMAAGADGLMIEVHINPDDALSDASQTISPDDLKDIVGSLKLISEPLGKSI